MLPNTQRSYNGRCTPKSMQTCRPLIDTGNSLFNSQPRSIGRIFPPRLPQFGKACNHRTTFTSRDSSRERLNRKRFGAQETGFGGWFQATNLGNCFVDERDIVVEDVAGSRPPGGLLGCPPTAGGRRVSGHASNPQDSRGCNPCLPRRPGKRVHRWCCRAAQ